MTLGHKEVKFRQNSTNAAIELHHERRKVQRNNEKAVRAREDEGKSPLGWECWRVSNRRARVLTK